MAIVCTPVLLGWGLSLLPNFEKGGGVDKISIFRGGMLVKREVIFSGKGCSFYIKNKLKYEVFNDKKSLQTKVFSLS